MNVAANVSWPLTSAFDCLIAQVPLNDIVLAKYKTFLSADCLRTFIQLYRGELKTKLYFFVLKYTGLILLLCNMRQRFKKNMHAQSCADINGHTGIDGSRQNLYIDHLLKSSKYNIKFLRDSEC
jgi:hypothetical protein